MERCKVCSEKLESWMKKCPVCDSEIYHPPATFEKLRTGIEKTFARQVFEVTVSIFLRLAAISVAVGVAIGAVRTAGLPEFKAYYPYSWSVVPLVGALRTTMLPLPNRGLATPGIA